MTYYNAQTYELFKADPLGRMQSLHANFAAGFKTQCQKGASASGSVITPNSPFATMTTEQVKMAHATIVAFESSPYGSSTPSNAWTLEAIVASPTIACTQYTKLAMHLYGAISPYANNRKKTITSDNLLVANPAYDPSKPIIEAVGWDGGAIGNHVHILFYDPANAAYPWMLCCPTLGILAMGASLGVLTSNIALPPQNIVEFYTNWNPTRTNILSAHNALKNVIGSDNANSASLLYCFQGLDMFTNNRSADWLTERAWWI